MKKLIITLLFVLPFSMSALTQDQAVSLINVVRSSPGTPASAFTTLITTFSNITIKQAESLIGVVQTAPNVPANAFVSLLISFTENVVQPIATIYPIYTTPTRVPVLTKLSGKTYNDLSYNETNLYMYGSGCDVMNLFITALDQDGLPMSGVPITFTNPETGTKVTRLTDSAHSSIGKEQVLFWFNPQTAENTTYNLLFNSGNISMSKPITVTPRYRQEDLKDPNYFSNHFRQSYDGSWTDTNGLKMDIEKGVCVGGITKGD